MRIAVVPDRNRASCARRLAAVAPASPDTTSLRPTNMANVLVRMVINQQKPAILAVKSGDVSAIRCVMARVLHCRSDRFATAPQPHRGGQKQRGDYQPDPQAGSGQESARSELVQVIDVPVAAAECRRYGA